MRRASKILFVIIAALILFLVIVWFADREPSYGGKTVTEWLDTLVLYDMQTQPIGTVITPRSPNVITNGPASHALQAIGPKSIPILVQRITDAPEWSPTNRLRLNVLRWIDWKLEQIKSTRPVPKLVLTTFEEFQRKRKTAAGLMLVTLDTNANGGILHFIETYGAVPRFKVTGPPIGVTPSDVARSAYATLPYRRTELVHQIAMGLNHTNPTCRMAALECARGMREELWRWKDDAIRLSSDHDEFVQLNALFVLSELINMRRIENNVVAGITKSVMEDARTPERNRKYATNLFKSTSFLMVVP